MTPGLDAAIYEAAVRSAAKPIVEGRLVEAVGLVLRATGCHASIGDMFEIHSERARVEAEVVGLGAGSTLLMPLGETTGLTVGARLRPSARGAFVPVGDALLGRVLDGLGRPLDGAPLPSLLQTRPLYSPPPSPLLRAPVKEPFWIGIRAIDGLLTLGKGQRIGIFAGGGVGKSTLLGMMLRRAEADVCVVGLIGERGREVEEFVHSVLGTTGLERSVVVAATSADPPLVRARGALLATAIAEHFRAEGKQVLLVMDSLTRYAMALREIGLAAGEPPTTKGYTPSVFAMLPRLLERAGTGTNGGAITGVYTVLVEGDDLVDPIADSTRAILDGHIVLARALAERGRFPAIDVLKSVSRVMDHVVPRAHAEAARRARELIASHDEASDLVAIGAYRQGAAPRLDEALARMPALERFLTQRIDERTADASTLAALQTVWGDAK